MASVRSSSLSLQPAEGIEPTTTALQKRCSTVELRWPERPRLIVLPPEPHEFIGTNLDGQQRKQPDCHQQLYASSIAAPLSRRLVSAKSLVDEDGSYKRSRIIRSIARLVVANQRRIPADMKFIVANVFRLAGQQKHASNILLRKGLQPTGLPGLEPGTPSVVRSWLPRRPVTAKAPAEAGSPMYHAKLPPTPASPRRLTLSRPQPPPHRGDSPSRSFAWAVVPVSVASQSIAGHCRDSTHGAT